MNSVVLRKKGDEYRGSLDCVEILEPKEYELYLIVDNNGMGDIFDVFIMEKGEKIVLGQMTHHYGNNGQGKLAASSFKAAKGVNVSWDEDRIYDPNDETVAEGRVKEIRLRLAPDEYRGDKHCVEIITPHNLESRVHRHGKGDDYAVKVNGVVVGKLTQYYGNNGQGKLASEEFVSVDGVEEIWEEL